MYVHTYIGLCVFTIGLQVFMYFHITVAPVIADGVSASDVPLDIDVHLVSLTLHCPIRNSSPAPNVVWLRNGIPIYSKNNLSFDTAQVSPIVNGYDYILKIVSNNRTYQFVYDNVIGMYQCIASNEVGHVIINRRVLFKCKL